MKQMRTRAWVLVFTFSAFWLPRPGLATPPGKTTLVKRTSRSLRQLMIRGRSAVKGRWQAFQHHRRVERGFKEVVKQHPDDLGQIMAQGKKKTRSASRIKWSSGAISLLGAAASIAYPVLLPVAVGSGTASYIAHRYQRGKTNRAKVQAMRHAMLEGYSIPGETSAHYRPLVVKAVSKDIASAKKQLARGTSRLKWMKPGVDRARRRAMTAVKRYQRKKRPFLQTQSQVRSAGVQLQQLGQQLQSLEPPQDLSQ
jgi:hypothetical protein